MKNNLLLILIITISLLHGLKAQDTATLHKLKALDTATFCPSPSEQTESNSLFNVYPNPTKGTFHIVYGSSTECPPYGWGGMLIINIMNSYYTTVYSETILVFEGEYDKTIDLSTMEKGVYIIELVTGKKKKVKREVLQ